MTRLNLAAHNGARLYGGAERQLVRLLARLRERGHRVTLFCRDEETAAAARGAGVPTERFRLGGHASIHDAGRFAARLVRLRPDALLLGTFKKTWLGALAGRIAGVPRVVARIGLETDLPGRGVVYRVAFRRWVDRVVVNAAELRAPVLASLPSLPGDRVVVIPNAVDAGAPPAVAAAGGAALRRSLGIPEDAPVVGAVARLAPQKRLDLLLRAVARMDRVRCVIAGDGPERDRLARAARALRVEDRVALLGARADVADVLAALDVYAVTSRAEGMSSAMLEALAAGVPVVSTRVSGAAEALAARAGRRAPGVLVDASEEGVVAGLSRLLQDPAGRAEMGAEGRAVVAERFAWPEQLARWEGVLADA